MTVEEMLAWVATASYEQLLRKHRFEPVGSRWFTEKPVYDAVNNRMAELRTGDATLHVAASKAIGWGEIG